MAVGAGVDAVWSVVSDIPRVAPCIPGAEIDRALDERHYTGHVRVKVGPLALTFGGQLSVEELDPDAKRIILRGAGRDPRGLGQADATITITATPDGAATSIEIVTDLRLGGPVAQFGRQAIVSDIARRMLDQFGGCLAERINERSAAPKEKGA